MRREIDEQLARVASRYDHVFTREHAEAAGADKRVRHRRVASGLWVRVGANAFRFATTPLTWRGQLWASYWDAGRRSYISHDAAAQTARFPGYTDNAVHVLVPRALDHVCTIATVHESRRFDLVKAQTSRGLPVVAPADTLVHIAPGLRYARLSWLTDELLLARRIALRELADALDRLGPGCRGLRPLRAVVADHSPGEPVPESELEGRFLDVARRFGLPEFERQVALPGRDEQPGRVDFIWRDVKLIVELDGRRWHARFADFDRDHRRDLHWLSRGYRTARITWSMLLLDPEGVCAELLAARLSVASNHPGVPVPGPAFR